MQKMRGIGKNKSYMFLDSHLFFTVSKQNFYSNIVDEMNTHSIIADGTSTRQHIIMEHICGLK